MLKKIGPTEIIAFLGLSAGLSFTLYAIMIKGYFAVIAPGMWGYYLESNLVHGAVIFIPYLMVFLCLIVSVFHFYNSVNEFYYIRNGSIPVNSRDFRVSYFILIVLINGLLMVFPLYFIVFLDKNYFRTSSLIVFLTFMFYTIFIFYFRNTIRLIYLVITIFGAVSSLYISLEMYGRYLAVSDLNDKNNRYSIKTDDRSYVNVPLLRSSSSSLIIRVGDAIVFIDRQSVKRIEREVTKDF